MQAGKLRHRVELQRVTNSQDPQSGANIETWQLFATVWASIEPLSARDFIAAQAAQNQISARAVIRYRPKIAAGMRLIQGSATYLIEGVLPDKQSGQEYLTLLLKTDGG